MQPNIENLEPERYELTESPLYQFQPNRREFFEAAGFIILLGSGSLLDAQTDSKPRARLSTAPDGTATVYSGKTDLGQGAATELAMAVAEELRIPLSKVRAVLGDTDLCPDDGITAGSRTTPYTIPEARKAAAAQRGGELTPPAAWKVLGKSQPAFNARAIVTGQHQYPSDIRRPGMLYAVVLRPPSFGAKLTSIDTTVIKDKSITVVNDNGFVACAAPSSHAARKAIAQLAATALWETKPHPSSKVLFQQLKQTAKSPRENKRGDVTSALSQATKKLTATYQTPHIQHAPMEPRAAVAEWVDGKLTVWTGTQNPFGVQEQLQQAFRIPAEKVRVIEPGSGGGFGGKHTGEVAIEAARLAKEANKPVHLRWTRAEEFTWAYSRPAGLFEIEASLDDKGLITAWDFVTYNAGAAGLDTPYRIPNVRTRFHLCDSPLREGSYRGIAATTNNFARECFMDELAALAGQDPLDFRLAHCDNPRLRDVIVAVTDKFNWRNRRKTAKAKTATGLAAGFEKGSYVAACVEVTTDPKTGFTITDFHMAYECGAILNPSNLRAQVEGSIIQGLGGALMEKLDFENGRLTNGTFAQYKMPRFRDVPPITITLLDRKDLTPVGAGETPIVVVAPAIASAVAALTKQPQRALPLWKA
jgi:CO/xanthine dehydrogenase Mo-binding subunit